MKRFLASIALLLSTSVPAQTYLTGKDLYMHLLSNDRVVVSIAAAYIVGVVEASYQVNHCAPKLKVVMLAELAIMNIENQMERAETTPADHFIVPPLEQMYPCKENSV